MALGQQSLILQDYATAGIPLILPGIVIVRRHMLTMGVIVKLGIE
jgi:hypothetical protein